MSVCLSLRSFVSLSISLSIYSLVRLSVLRSISPNSVFVSICPSKCPFLCLSIHSYFNNSIHPFFGLSICPSLCMSSVCLHLNNSVYLSLSISSSICPFVHQNFYQSTCSFLSLFISPSHYAPFIPFVYMSVCPFLSPLLSILIQDTR